MIRVVEGRDPSAARRILTALPDWFGDEEAIDQYVADAADTALQSLLAVEDDHVVGLELVRRRFPSSGELHLIAVDPAHRGRGAGRALVERAACLLRADGAS